MKNTTSLYESLKRIFAFVALISVALIAVSSENDAILNLRFKQFSIFNSLPTNEIQKVYQDKDGLMWFASRYGFCQYDGYKVNLYKSNLYTPGLLTNNNVYCLTEDNDHHLWIGTQEGLNMLNKKTGEIRKYLYPAISNNVVSCLLVTRDNTVWVGTDAGLCRYIAERDSFVVYEGELAGNVLPRCAVKTLFEDSEGDIWIGTWDWGLYRYVPSTNTFYSYPRINDRNSAHVVYEDSDKNIWVGSWDRGLFKLQSPKDMERVSYINYKHIVGDDNSLSDNIVYDIAEDLNSRTLWVGTRSGLSIMKDDAPGQFINYKSTKSPYHIPCDEINSIIRDNFGNMWIGSIGGGVLMAYTHQSLFTQHSLNLVDEDIPTTSIRALFADTDGNLWMGIGTYGLACKDSATGKLLPQSCIPEFSGISSVPTVYSIIQRNENGDIWFGTYDGGIFIYKKGEKVRNLDVSNCDFIASSCISSLYEDKEGNCWVGTRGSLGVSLSDGKSFLFETMDFEDKLSTDWIYVRDIAEDTDKSMWVATANYGIIHIMGDVRQPQTLKYRNFSFHNQKLLTNTVLCLHLDKSGRLWAGTEGGGLYLYNRETGAFEDKNREYNIPGDMVGSIEESERGVLWLGTNAGLVRLNAPMGQEIPDRKSVV